MISAIAKKNADKVKGSHECQVCLGRGRRVAVSKG